MGRSGQLSQSAHGRLDGVLREPTSGEEGAGHIAGGRGGNQIGGVSCPLLIWNDQCKRLGLAPSAQEGVGVRVERQLSPGSTSCETGAFSRARNCELGNLQASPYDCSARRGVPLRGGDLL